MRFFISIFVFVFLFQECRSQVEYDPTIKVIKGNDTLQNPWAGGLNHVQISDFDFDLDGDLDLFIFDISSNNIRVLIQNHDGVTPYYSLFYNARDFFPNDIIYKGVMIDYDNDGREDLWTYGTSGLKVYRNVGDPLNGIQWQLSKELIYSEYLNGIQPLQISLSDMPAIADIDYDGDIDILTFNLSGEVVEYHQNQSMDLYGTPDSLVFELKNQCWGLFREGATNNTITLNDQSYPCVGGGITNPEYQIDTTTDNSANAKMHAGSSLLALDLDDSGVMDLILGDSYSSNLISVLNGGVSPNTNSAMVSQDASFPSYNVALDLQLFPVAFYLDVDFDSIKDLVVGNNVRNLAENESGIWFYKNIGTNDLPNFSFQQTNLFQSEMIEHGTGSIPILFDENEDGLMDLLVGNFHRFIPPLDKESTVALYRNSGTSNSPEFTYIDYDYLNLSQANYGYRVSPCFGDIDGDGDQDMYLGRTNGSLVYYENASSGGGAIFTIASPNVQDDLGSIIDVGDYSFPQLFDLNKDSLLDLLIGTRTGEIFYYQNVGTQHAPIFQHVDSTLGQVDVSGLNIQGFSSPHFFRRNDTTYLICGAYDGKLHYYDQIDGNLLPNDSFNLVTDFYGGINVDAYSTVVVSDIDNNQDLNIFVGQELGGVFHFNETNINTISVNELSLDATISIYPNPVNNEVTVESSKQIISKLIIIDALGKTKWTSYPNSSKTTVPFSSHENGTYFIKIVFENGEIAVERIMKM